MKNDTNESNEPISIHPQQTRFYHVRITADPTNPRSVDVVEELLTKCVLSRCTSSSEDGTSVWDIIVHEELLDEALDGIAVTVPVDYELFKDEEGHLCLVTSKEWYRLGGIAEDTATCWEGDDLDDFEGEVTQDLRNLIQAELEEIPWPGDDIGDEIFGRTEERVIAEMDVYAWSEEDVYDSVQAAYKEATKSNESLEE